MLKGKYSPNSSSCPMRNSFISYKAIRKSEASRITLVRFSPALSPCNKNNITKSWSVPIHKISLLSSPKLFPTSKFNKSSNSSKRESKTSSNPTCETVYQISKRMISTKRNGSRTICFSLCFSFKNLNTPKSFKKIT